MSTPVPNRVNTGTYLEITLKAFKEQEQGNCSGMRKERLLQLSKTFALRQMKQRPWQEITVVSQVVTLNIQLMVLE